jgi:hypothetical protein
MVQRCILLVMLKNTLLQSHTAVSKVSNNVLEKPASSAYHEDERSSFLRNVYVYTYLANNMASHSRRQQCSKHEAVNIVEGDKSLYFTVPYN